MHNGITLIPLAAALLMSAGGIANAGSPPVVTQISGSGSSSYSTTASSDIPGAYNVLITISGTVDEEWDILGELIDTISFSQTPANSVEVDVETGLLRFFSGVNGSNGPIVLRTLAAENVDYVFASEIEDIEVETIGESGYLFVDAEPTIFSLNDIDNIEVTDFANCNIAALGDLGILKVTNGLNLSLSAAIDIEGNIEVLEAGAIDGVISVGNSSDSSSGYIGRMNIATPNTIANKDNFLAALTAKGIGAAPSGFTTAGIFIRGDMLRSISLTGGLRDGALVSVGGTLGSVSYAPPAITLPEGGLEGQIIANAYNNGGGWIGEIRIPVSSVNQDLLPGYSQLPSELGGGAAGLAPFDLHEDDCDPVQDGFVTNGEIDIEDPELACEKIDFKPEIELYGKLALSGDIDDAGECRGLERQRVGFRRV